MLVDFIAECTIPDEELSWDASKSEIDTQGNWWILHMDGATNSHGSGVGLIISSPDKVIVEYALRFNFCTMNNMVEYKALNMGLKIIRELDANEVKMFSNSQLIISQVLGK